MSGGVKGLSTVGVDRAGTEARPAETLDRETSYLTTGGRLTDARQMLNHLHALLPRSFPLA